MAYGYVIVDMKINDMDGFKAYMAAAPASIKDAGGEYLTRGGKIESLEGAWQPTRMTILRFPSFEQAKQWYDSEMYRQARAKRADTTDYFNLVLTEGIDAPVENSSPQQDQGKP